MYIGRNGNRKIEPDSLDKIILDYLKSLGFVMGEKIDKRYAEISQMTDKGPLDKYLESGLKKH